MSTPNKDTFNGGGAGDGGNEGSAPPPSNTEGYGAAVASGARDEEAAAATKFVDEAGNYLSEYNFRTLMEWLTAEALFEMPEDPLSFVCAVTKDRLRQRTQHGYRASDADDYLHECYDLQSSDSKRHEKSVRLRSMQTELLQGEPAKEQQPEDGNTSQRLQLLQNLIEASRSIATELDPMDATHNIIKECTKLLEADRATLFKLDEPKEELVLMVAEGAKSIRVPLGQGIAGTVASTGKAENIADAYQDSRFDPSNDQKTGYTTKNILAAPVRDAGGRIVGVVQAINCLREGSTGFSKTDEEVIDILAAQAGIALRNADLFQQTRRSQNKVRAMVEVIKSINSDLGINSLMFTIGQKTPALVDAERCTFYLAKHSARELWAVQGDINFKISIDQGIAGSVVTEKDVLNIADAYEHPRFNPENDKSTGYRTRQMLCVPLFGSSSTSEDGEPEVIAVLQLINKIGTTESFSKEDEELVTLFGKLVGPIIEKSQLFQHQNRKGNANELGSDYTKGRTNKDSSAAPATIQEGEEEDGDEEEEEGAEQ